MSAHTLLQNPSEELQKESVASMHANFVYVDVTLCSSDRSSGIFRSANPHHHISYALDPSGYPLDHAHPMIVFNTWPTEDLVELPEASQTGKDIRG